MTGVDLLKEWEKHKASKTKKKSKLSVVSVTPEIQKTGIEIPERLKKFSFVLCDAEKRPIQKGWQKKIIKSDSPELINHINANKNYGVVTGEKSLIVHEDKTNFLIVVDFDKKDFQDKVLLKFPETFTTTSGSEKNCVHLWFATDHDKPFKILDENQNTLTDVLATGKQIIAPGSKHQSGSVYTVVKDVDFAFIPYAEIEAILRPYDRTPQKKIKPQKQYSPAGVSDDITNKIYSAVSMKDILGELGIDTNKNPTDCPFHSSVGGKCLGWSEETAHCFHCEGSWNKFSLIRACLKKTDKETFKWFAEKSGMLEEFEQSQLAHLKSKKKKETAEDVIKETEKNFDDFLKVYPVFFDEHLIYWKWEESEKAWKMCDGVDVLNLTEDFFNLTTEKLSKFGSYFLKIIQQKSRRHKPQELPEYCIQFKEKIYDLKNKKEFAASPKYFSTSPIPYNLSDSDETPTIDKLFVEWVGADKAENLYEVVAYAAIREQFLQTIIALTGSGSNGKGTFQNLLIKFLGKQNCVSSNIKSIINRSFETSALYKKLLCIIGEVDAADLSNTNQIKQMTGEDLIRYEFKGKTPFSESSPTTFIIATNSLPITPDKSDGFYRRWLIVDFPNQFSVKRDLLNQIPEQEFQNLTRKVVNTLIKLFEKSEFTNGGSIEERRRRYEERSNPMMMFISESFLEDGVSFYKLRDFAKEFNIYLKTKKLRPLTVSRIGKLLRDEGFEVSPRKFKNEDGEIVDSAKSIIGICKILTQCIEETGSSSSLTKEKQGVIEKTTETTETRYTPQQKIEKSLEELEQEADEYFEELGKIL